MQLRHVDVHVGEVVRVQGDPAYADAVGKEQIRLWGVIARPAIPFQEDASGTGAGRAVGTR